MDWKLSAICKEDIAKAKLDILNNRFTYYLTEPNQVSLFKRAGKYFNEISKKSNLTIDVSQQACVIKNNEIYGCYKVYMNKIIDTFNNINIIDNFIHAGDSLYVIDNLNNTFSVRNNNLTYLETKPKVITDDSLELDFNKFVSKYAIKKIASAPDLKNIPKTLSNTILYYRGILYKYGKLNFEQFGFTMQQGKQFNKNETIKLKIIESNLKEYLENRIYIVSESYGHKINLEIEDWIKL